MKISILTSADESTHQMKREIVPFIFDFLKTSSIFEDTYLEREFLNFRKRYSFSEDDDFILLLNFDAKTCQSPDKYCNAECEQCSYNPLYSLIFQEATGNRPLVLTHQDTINTLLNICSLFIKILKKIPFSSFMK